MSIADKLQTIQNIKENIKTAINNKGGNVGDNFNDYAEAINNIEGSNCDEAFEQGKATQKALLTSETFTKNGTFRRENGWNEVVVNYQPFGLLSNTLIYAVEDIFDMIANEGLEWSRRMEAYKQEHTDVVSNGMMYVIDIQPSGNIDIKNFYEDIMVALCKPWGNTLVTPWLYNEYNSPSKTIILPDYWYGGFDCEDVVYINNVFQGAESLKCITHLTELGKSFASVCTLDLSVLTKLNDEYYDGDCFIILANSVYNFTKQGINVNGISYSNVKLPSDAEEEQISAWTSVGWVVTM